MSKKSAAQAKVIKRKQEPKPEVDPKQEFEEQKQFEITILEQQLICVNRIDFLDDLRADYKDYLGYYPPALDIKTYANEAGGIFHEILNRVKKYKYEDFEKEEMVNPFEDMIICISDVEEDDESMWWAHMIYRLVRPYGEHANSIHQRILEIKREQAVD